MFNRVFVVFQSDEFKADMDQRVQSDDAENLRRLQQRDDGAAMIWRSWCMANDGSVITTGQGAGSFECPPQKLSDLPRLHTQYTGAIGAKVAVGVGAKLSEAQKALSVAKLRGGDQIVLWSKGVDDELQRGSREQASNDPIDDILAQGNLRKAWEDDERPGHGAPVSISEGSGSRRPATLQRVVEEPGRQYAEVQDGVDGGIRRFERLRYRGPVGGDGTPPPDAAPLLTNTWQETEVPCDDLPRRFGSGYPHCSKDRSCPRCRGTGWTKFGSGANLSFSPFQASDSDDSMRKALPGQNLAQNAGGGFGGFSTGSGATPPTPPMQEASEHSDAEGAQSQVDAAAEAPPPEMTHAAQDLSTQFHQLAGQQEVKDAQDVQAQQKNLTAIKGAVVSVLQQVRGQSAKLGALKQEDPDIYNSVMGLVQSVITIAHQLQGASPPQATTMQKSEALTKAAIREWDRSPPENMEARRGSQEHIAVGQHVTLEPDYHGAPLEMRTPQKAAEAAALAERGVSLAVPGIIQRVHVDEEHPQGPRVHAVEVQDQETGRTHVFGRFGNTWNCVRHFNPNGIREITREHDRAAAEDFDAPAVTDPLMAKHKVQLSGLDSFATQAPQAQLSQAHGRVWLRFHPHAPADDEAPGVPMDKAEPEAMKRQRRPPAQPYEVVVREPATNTWSPRPETVSRFEDVSLALQEGKRHIGPGFSVHVRPVKHSPNSPHYFSSFDGEDFHTHPMDHRKHQCEECKAPYDCEACKRFIPAQQGGGEDMEKAGIRLPMPKAPTHKDLELPVGSEKNGSVKVEHGAGGTSWKEMRAGQVQAVADRHADPIVGMASHPTSSRNPMGKSEADT